MPNPTTILLSVIAVGAVIYTVGTERTAEAAGTAAGATKRVATSGITLGAAGAIGGIEIGNQLLQAIAAEPFAFTTAVAGIMGALGIEGFLAPLTGPQFLLIGFLTFLLVYMVQSR